MQVKGTRYECEQAKARKLRTRSRQSRKFADDKTEGFLLHCMATKK